MFLLPFSLLLLGKCGIKHGGEKVHLCPNS
jgi:hypothetical protein